GAVWDGMKRMFHELTKRLQNDKNEFKKLCEEVHLQDTTEGTIKKEICKALVQIKLFMSGIKVQDDNAGYGFDVENMEEVESYLRCMIGTVAASKLFKEHSCLGDVAEYVVGILGMFLDAEELKGKKGKCGNFDFRTVKLGKELIGKEIEKWVKSAKGDIGIIRETNKHNACKKTSKEDRRADAKGGQDQGLIRKLFGIEDDTQLKEMADTSNSLSEEGAKEVLQKVKEGRITDDKMLQQEVDSKIQKEKEEASQPQSSGAGEHCKDKKYLCERALCVADYYREDSGKKPNWDKMWGDVNGYVDKLSTGILNKRAETEQYCNGSSGTNKEVCQVITAGLKHIYEIKEEKIGGEKKNNQLFNQTMACVLLNALIRKLKEKQSPCNIDIGIEKAFNVAEQYRKNWCVNKNRGDCDLCDQEKEYKNCQLGGKNLWEEVKTKLEGNQQITQTLSTIDTLCKDCSKEDNLCARTKCVARKWGINKREDATWSNMESDINKEASEMFKKISQDTSKSIANYCSDSDPSSRRVTDPEIKACKLISRGLKHIYEIKEDKSDDTEQKRKDNQLFKQTMMCLLLNAYADELKKQVKSPCEVSEQTIAQSFEEGNKELTKSCKGKNSEKGHCVQCDRYDQYADCQIDSEKIGDKLETMLRKDGNVQQTLTDISTINNTLCDRAQCVTTQWTRDRRQGGQTKWEYHIWDDKDMEKILNAICAAIANGYMNEAGACKNIVDKDNTTSEAKKLACQLITAGLRYIYGIMEDQKGTTEERKRNDKIFKQTMACMALNVFAKEILKGRCKITEEILTQTFEDGKGLYTTMCSSSNNCQKCEWDSCSKPTFNNSQLRQKIKEELLKNAEINKTLEEICKKDTQPEAAPAAPAEKTPVMKAKEDGYDSQVNGGTGVLRAPSPSLGGGDDKVSQSPAKDDLQGPPDGIPAGPGVGTQGSGGGISSQSTSSSGGGGKSEALPKTPKTLKVVNVKEEGMVDPSDLTPYLPYLPLAPVFIGMSAMSYLLWKYFGILRKTRKRYRRAHQIRGPSLEQKIVDHVDQDGPQVLNECQKGDLHSTKEDFFEILVQEFMGSEFMKEENVPKEQVPSSDSGFRVHVPKEDFLKEDVPSSDSAFREDDFVPKEEFPSVDVPKEEFPSIDVPKECVPSLNSGFREEESVPKEDVPGGNVPEEQVPCSDSGFRKEDVLPKEQ
ncbi:SICA antigen, partial [Plasmodium coatneyi]